MNQYRCETCKKEHRYADMGYRSQVLICEGEELPINCENFTESKGCASHSDFQSERDKVLDDVVQYIVKHSWEHNTLKIDVVTRYPLVEFIQVLRQKAGE